MGQGAYDEYAPHETVQGTQFDSYTVRMSPNPTHARRPRIGLALGGGGAKGAAHVGVLQVLEELRIPIDCVAGTSMGALIGATFAAGKAPDDIERAVVGIDWTQTVGGQQLRDRMPIGRKLAEVTYSNSLEFGLGNGRLRTPAGFIQTQDIEDEIWGLVSTAQSVRNFDDLPIPFRAIATDMIAGEMVVLDSGDLSVAMRASMALPGAFSPIEVEGKVLADGGMMRNLPVDVARDLCADVVIAVWMSSPPPDPGDVTSALSLFGRSFDVMIGANQKAQIATLTAADIGIEVPMGDIETGDFLRVADAVALGKSAANANRAVLSRYSVSEPEYLAWQESTGHRPTEIYRFEDIRILGNERVSSEYILSSVTAAVPGAGVSVRDIAEGAEQIYALGDFERVSYRLTGPVGQQVLEYTTAEKSWGPNFFRFDLGLAAHGDSDLQAILRADHDRTWINSKGGRWHNAVQIGQQTVLTTDFYQPIDTKQRFFVQPSASFENDFEDVYLDHDRVARYLIRQLYGQLDFGLNLGTSAQFRLGLRHGWEEADLDTGLPGLPELARQSDTNLQLRAIYDTRNSVALPTRGSLLHARYIRSLSWFGSDLDYDLLEGVALHSWNLNGNSLSFIAGGGVTLSGELPVTQTIELGGIRTFPGLRPGELRGSEYWFAGTNYYWRLADIQPLFGQALYAGLRLQAGQVNGRFDQIREGALVGISGSLSGKFPIGAFLLSLGYVDNGSLRLQFTLGRPVSEGSMLDDIH